MLIWGKIGQLLMQTFATLWNMASEVPGDRFQYGK